MNTIEELIQKECPEGVEYLPLGEVCEIRGRIGFRGYTRNDLVSKGEGAISLSPSNIINGRLDYTNCAYVSWAKYEESPEIMIEEDDVIFCKTASVGKCGIIKNLPEKATINPQFVVFKNIRCNHDFLYYVVSGKEFQSKIYKIRGLGSIPTLSQKDMSMLEIPVPPLSVQHKIVEILDKFTSLEAELQAELEARKKQYEYYRNQLLDFTGREDVEWKPIKQLFETRNGYTPSKNNPEYWENGDIPWFRMEDIRANGRILSDSILHVNKCGVKGNLFPKDSLIVATSATIGEHALIKCESLSNQRFTYLMLKSQYKDRFDIKFLFYYCFVLDKWCLANVNQGGFASVNMPAFYDFQFPVPSLAEQEKIASILDKFEELINGQKASLSAEIKARHQQYEYYRDKLLSFKCKD